jgi:hypothetical protein
MNRLWPSINAQLGAVSGFHYLHFDANALHSTISAVCLWDWGAMKFFGAPSRGRLRGKHQHQRAIPFEPPQSLISKLELSMKADTML